MADPESIPELVSVRTLARRWGVPGRELKAAARRLGIRVWQVAGRFDRIAAADLPRLCRPEPTARQVMDRRHAVVQMAAAVVERQQPGGAAGRRHGNTAGTAGGIGAP